MTSKEALQKIQLSLYVPTRPVYDIDNDELKIDIIRRDLEVLEIIQELILGNCKIYYTRDKHTISLELYGSDFEIMVEKGTKEYKQIETIKRWLENEKYLHVKITS